jgi:hypothetical protein
LLTLLLEHPLRGAPLRGAVDRQGPIAIQQLNHETTENQVFILLYVPTLWRIRKFVQFTLVQSVSKFKTYLMDKIKKQISRSS